MYQQIDGTGQGVWKLFFHHVYFLSEIRHERLCTACLCPFPIHVEALALNMMVFEGSALGRYLALDEVLRVGFTPSENEDRFSLHMHTPRKGHVNK